MAGNILAGLGALATGGLGGFFGGRARERAQRVQEDALKRQEQLIEGAVQEQIGQQQEARKAFERRRRNQLRQIEQKQARRSTLGTPTGLAETQATEQAGIQSADVLAAELAEQRGELDRRRRLALADVASRRGALGAEQAARDPRANIFGGLSGFLAGEAVKDKPFGGLQDVFKSRGGSRRRGGRDFTPFRTRTPGRSVSRSRNFRSRVARGDF